MRCSRDMGVSVVVTLYNYMQFVGDCMSSFRRQVVSFPIEMLVVDDGSTDKGAALVSRTSRLPGHPIRLISLGKNTGYANAKNVGIRSSSFEFIKMLDADDMLCDGSLQKCFDFINANDIDFMHGPCIKLCRRDGRWVEEGIHQQWDRWKKERNGLQPWTGVHAQGTMYRRSLHSLHGMYDITLPSKADREMWARLHARGVALNAADFTVAVYRQHDLQMSRSKRKRSTDQKLHSYLLDAVRRRATGDMSGVELL